MFDEKEKSTILVWIVTAGFFLMMLFAACPCGCGNKKPCGKKPVSPDVAKSKAEIEALRAQQSQNPQVRRGSNS